MAPIDHVVVLMMENAAFDRMVGCMTEIHKDLDGVDPDNPRTNPDIDGTPIPQAPTHARNIDRDPMHYLHDGISQLAGNTNTGFVIDFAAHYPTSTVEERREIMGWYPRGFLPALHTLAEHFVMCDRWFSSLPGPTWINRLFAHAGSSLGEIDEPRGVFTSKLHLYDERTLYDELHDAGAPWRIYYGDVPQSLVLTHQYDHLGSYRQFGDFAADVARGDLPAYTFIEPSYFGAEENDQHPPHDVLIGDRLIAQVYNTLRGNAELFARTLLIVVYDEHGGFFDHVVPPPTVAPDDNTRKYQFDQLGFRVPALLISPLLDPGVCHTVFDHTSLIRMASEKWPGVKPLGRRSPIANDPIAAVTWRTTPRTDLPEAPIAQDIQQARQLDTLAGFKESLFGLSQHIESQIANPARRGLLMTRAHEGLGDGWAQGNLAAARMEALMAESVVSRVAHAVGDVVKRVF